MPSPPTSPSSSPPTSSSSTISTAPTVVESTIIQEDNLQALLNWASTDADIKKLIQREHIAGRIDQAINFANFMETFEENPEAKQLYRTKDNFYAVLRSKYTKKREDGGFSASSCKRLKVEGDCYISLQKAHHTKFPQSQNVAVALKGCTTQQNIVDIWNAALGIYEGDEKCILKRDIPVALDIYNRARLAAPAVDAPPVPEIARLQQRIQELEAQIAAPAVAVLPAPDIALLQQRIQELEAQIAAPAAPAAPAPDIALLQQRIQELEAQIAAPPVDPQVVLYKTQKKLEYAEKCLNDIDKNSILAFYKRTEEARFTAVSSFDELQELFKENKTLSDQEQPLKYEIGIYHDEEIPHIVLKDLPHWRSLVWRHFKRLVEKTDEVIEKKKELCDDLDIESDIEPESETDGEPESEVDE